MYFEFIKIFAKTNDEKNDDPGILLLFLNFLKIQLKLSGNLTIVPLQRFSCSKNAKFEQY